jgi:hypothetical protein
LILGPPVRARTIGTVTLSAIPAPFSPPGGGLGESDPAEPECPFGLGSRDRSAVPAGHATL